MKEKKKIMEAKLQRTWRVVVTDYIEQDLDWERAHLAHWREIEFEAFQLKQAPEAEIIPAVKDADILVVNMMPLPRRIIQALDRCRLVIRHGVGYDNIDVAALTERGILFINVPDYCVEEVAEQTVMLLLNCARRFALQQQAMQQSVASGEWQFKAVTPIYCLSGKTLGIVGCGRIGSMVFRITKGFQMRYLICDPYLTPERKAELGITTVPLAETLKGADFLTIHTPLTAETHHLIGQAELRLMKPSAFLINTARGGIVDEAALIRACQEGWIAGAAIDVYEHREPPQPDSPLLKIKNIYFTPHLAWYSVESEWRIREKIIENIVRMVSGQLPYNIVNPEVLNKVPS